MKTPQLFIDEYNGKSVNRGYGWNDSYYGYQCVAGFKTFCEWAGIGAYPTGTNYADGYWYLRNDTPKSVANFNFIENASQLKKGDWCFWAHGSSNPESHVAMFVDYAGDGYGYFFGENQGFYNGFSGFQTVKARLDILGAFRWKQWADSSSKLVDGLQTIVYQNATYHVYKSYNGMKLYMLSAVGGDHATQDITKYDDDNLTIYAMANCNYFQMNERDYGQHYGVEVSRGDGIHSEANRYFPPNEKYIAYYETKSGDDGYIRANDFYDENVSFACSPYSVRIHNGVEMNDISTAFTNKEDYATNQTAYFKLKSGEWCIAVSESAVKPQTIVNALKAVAEIEELFIVDGGGSSQLWAFDREAKAMTKARYTGRKIPNVLCLAIEQKAPAENDQKEDSGSDTQPIIPPAEQIPVEDKDSQETPKSDEIEDIVNDATKDGYLFEMSDRVYDWLKVVTAFIIPLLIREYPRFAQIWGWGYSEQVVNTLAELITIINAVLYVSSVGYEKKKRGDKK